jgi:outer membrane protein TolC
MSLTRQSRLPRRLAASLTMLLLAACAVGPNFKRPAAPQVSDYTAHPQSSTVATADTAGGAAQRFAKGGDLAADWWTLFHSAALNALIDQSLKRNPDLKAAE